MARKRSAAAAARASGGAAGEVIRASAVSGMVDHTRRAAIVRPSDSPATAPSGESERLLTGAPSIRSTPGPHAGVGQRLPDLPVAAAWGEERALARRSPPHRARHDAPGGARAHPATGLLAGELGRIDPPDLARVGEVEPLAEGGPEGGHQHLGEGVRARRPAQRAQGGVAQRPGGHARRQAPHQVQRAQGEGDPPAAEADAPVPRPRLKIVAQQRPQLGQDPRLDGRVQAVAAQIDAHAGHLAAGGGAAHERGPLEQRHAVPRRRRAVGGAQARRARSQHQQVAARRAQLRATEDVTRAPGAA